MAKLRPESLRTSDPEWMMFPGGELEGKRPRALCPTCRELLARAVPQAQPAQDRQGPLCFQCYRAELERDRALRAAGRLETASDARFQCTLPFDPVNTVRLAALKAARMAEREARSGQVIQRCADRRRQAQIAARHALRAIGNGVKRQLTSASTWERSFQALPERERPGERTAAEGTMVAAIHAAELQLPESWLPFVVSR